MDIDDDGVTDPTADFGELFEGQAEFESALGHVTDEMLGAIGNELGLGAGLHRATTDDILDANLSFGPDDYLQNQHMIIGNESAEYLEVDPLGDHLGQHHQQHQIQHLGDGIYIQQNPGQPSQIVVTTSSTGAPFISNNFVQGYQSQMQQLDENMAMANEIVPEGPKVKKKVKVVKDVKYFTNENLDRYLKRRGFKTKGLEKPTKTINKAVFALSSYNSQNNYSKLVTFGANYKPEHIIQEIERLLSFYQRTKSININISQELIPLLVPTLLHFYLEMIIAGNFAMARRILAEFAKKYITEDKTKENYDLLLAATKVNSVESLKANPVLNGIAKHRREFYLNELSLLHLRQFLSKSNLPILPNLFTTRFKIRQKETKELMKSFDWDDSLESDSGGDDDSSTEESESEDISASFAGGGHCMVKIKHEKDTHVQDVIDRLRNSVSANIPAISVYTSNDDPVCGAISKKGSLVAFGLKTAGISLFPLEEAGDSKSYSDEQETYHGVKSFSGHAGTVYGVHFHPRSKLLFSVGQDRLMRVWDLNNSNNVRCASIYRGHSGPIWALNIPDSGRMIATAGLDTTARIFLPERTEFVRIMVGHYFSVNTVKFHPNEAYIATGSTDKSARLWSVDDGNIVRMFTGVPGTVNTVAFHKSGKYLAGAGEGGKIVIWDLAEGEILATLNCLQDCKDLQFCGNMLAACYRNGMLQVFNLRSIVGGACVNFDIDCENTELPPPFTTKTSASTLFQVYYQNPGTLHCLGSENTKYEEFTSSKAPEMAKPENEAISKPTETNTISSPLLQQVLQTNTQLPSQAPTVNISSNANKILAARLSQPISRLSSIEDEGNELPVEIKEEESPVSLPIATTKGSSTPASQQPLVSNSQLHAAIASVIGQSSASSSGGEAGGTITMYASN